MVPAPVINHAPLLQTARLRLRPLAAEDAPAIQALRSDEAVNLYIQRPKTLSLEDAQAFIERTTKGIADGRGPYWAIERKDEPGLIGTTCLWNFSADRRQAEIGYELLPLYQGRGFMGEATEAVIHLAFEALQLQVLKAIVHPKNLPSQQLLLKQGFTLDTTNRFPMDEEDAGVWIYYRER